MNKTVDAGLEVVPSTDPQVVPSTDPQVVGQPDENKYHIGPERLDHPFSYQSCHPAHDQPSRSIDQPQVKSQGLVKTVGVLIIISVILLAVALGAGLGAGLSAHHKQSSSNDASTTIAESKNAPFTIIETSSASGSATITPTTATQSNQIATVTPTQDTLPSRRCPAINGTTYTATNKPYPIDRAQIPNSTLKFEILCDTDHGALKALQIIANVSTLNNCFDLCALYDFQMGHEYFPAQACTAVSWGYDTNANLHAGNTCWLNNILGSSQHIQPDLGYDSGILLLDT